MKHELPSGWTIKQAKDYCATVADGTHNTPKSVDEGKLLITSKNIKNGNVDFNGAYLISQGDFDDINRRSKVDRWDVLFSMIGTVGEIALVKNQPDFAIKNVGLFKPKSKIDGIWLYYYLISNIGKATIETNLSGSSQQFVSLGDLRKLLIIDPTIGSKKKIAAILSAYDDLIENNTRRIALLEKMAEEVYREWFVRLRFPGHESVPVHQGMPEGWEKKPLGEVCTFNVRTLSATKHPPEIEYVDISSVTTKRINQTEVFAFTDAPGRARRIVSHGDIIWSSVRPGNRAYCLILNPRPNLIVSTGFVVITAKQGVPYSYIYGVVTDDPFVDHLSSVAKGAAYPAVSKEDFEQANVLVSSCDLLERYDNHCMPILSQTWALDQYNQHLKATRDILLSRLLSGKLDVEELDIQFPPGMMAELVAGLQSAKADFATRSAIAPDFNPGNRDGRSQDE